MGLPTFDHYNSFLEISFAINVLFSAWNGWLGTSLKKKHPLQKDVKKLEMRIANLAEQNRTLSDLLLQIPKGIYSFVYSLLYKFGRVAGVFIAVCIAAALFYLRGETPIGLLEANLILASAVLLPLLTLVVLGTGAVLSWGIKRREGRLTVQEENARLRQELDQERAERKDIQKKLDSYISHIRSPTLRRR